MNKMQKFGLSLMLAAIAFGNLFFRVPNGSVIAASVFVLGLLFFVFED